MAITPQDAMQHAIGLYSGANLNPRDFKNSGWLSKAADQVGKLQFDLNWYSPSCASGQAPPLNLLQTSSGLALGTAAAGVGILGKTGLGLIPALSVPVVGQVIAGLSILVGFIKLIFAHHAAAVKRDLQFGCAALPAVNNAFVVVFQALQNGQTDSQSASQALDEIFSQFMIQGGATSPSNIPNGGTAINKSPYCNSNCEMSVIVKAMVIYGQSRLADVQLPIAPAPPARYSPTPYTAVGKIVPLSGAGSSVAAQNVGPVTGYGPLIVVLVVVAIVIVTRGRRGR
jgi:hypothetical protein